MTCEETEWHTHTQADTYNCAHGHIGSTHMHMYIYLYLFMYASVHVCMVNFQV